MEVTRPPRPPEDVKVTMPDGTVVPLELVYAGRRHEDGCHVWESVLALPVAPVSMRCARMPGQTTIRVLVQRP